MNKNLSDKDRKLNYILLADRFYEWCFDKSGFINCVDEEFDSLLGVLKKSKNVTELINTSNEILFALSSKFSNPNSISVEDITSFYEKEKGEVSVLISIIHGGEMNKTALFQRVTLKSPFNKSIKVKNLKS